MKQQHSLRIAASVSALVVLVLGPVFGAPCLSAAEARGVSAPVWQSADEPALGLAFSYPADWQVLREGVSGTTGDARSILLSSVLLPGGVVAADSDLPAGAVAVRVAPVAVVPPRPLEDLGRFAAAVPGVGELRPSGVRRLVGGKELVEMAGERVTVWLTRAGDNVYAISVFGGDGAARDERVAALVAGLRLEAARPLTAAALVPSDPASLTIPSMKFPFAGTSYYVGGPHNPANKTGCKPYAHSSMSAIDIGLLEGANVLAVAAGTVTYAQNTGGSSGKTVIIKHTNDFYTQYWHLKDISVGLGAVPQGKILGKAGNTGTTYVHLHLDFRTGDGSATTQAHGLTINGWKIRSYVPVGTGNGLNYQGTLTQGNESMPAVTMCSVNAYEWRGATATRWANANPGPNQSITSSNVAIP